MFPYLLRHGFVRYFCLYIPYIGLCITPRLLGLNLRGLVIQSTYASSCSGVEFSNMYSSRFSHSASSASNSSLWSFWCFHVQIAKAISRKIGTLNITAHAIKTSNQRTLSAPVRFCSFMANGECRKMAGKRVQPLNNYTCRFRPSSLKCTDKSGLDGLQADKLRVIKAVYHDIADRHKTTSHFGEKLHFPCGVDIPHF